VSAVVLAVGLRMLPPGAPVRRPDRTWWAEAVLLSAAVAALLLALSFTRHPRADTTLGAPTGRVTASGCGINPSCQCQVLVDRSPQTAPSFR
jgi:hypothetical protein